MNDDVTLVTAFFDIGRGDFNIVRCEPRSAQKYIDYFDFWARIQNKLVVYTSPEYAKQIRDVRKKYGRENETVIIEIEDIFAIEKDIYNRMKNIESDENFKDFRFWNKEVSNRADYNYIMLMKYWCMQDAVARGLCSNVVFWIDFGYNHGGVCYTKTEEFNFYITGTTNNKIQLYALPQKEPEKVSGIQSLQFQFDTFAGCPVVAPYSMCNELWQMTKTAMLSLISLDCIDDDQQLLLMAYKLHPECFEIHNSDWFMPLKEYWGGSYLTVKEKETIVSKKTFVRRLLGKIKRSIVRAKSRNQVQREDFICRMKKASELIYR
ncbi:MAG: hypothetical protein K6C98_07260 [Treponema sp.]|nr:hypothetical protein [Treponema sp.]